MSDDILQTIIQYGASAFVALLVLVVLVVISSTTDLGRAMLPDAVTSALAKLLPDSWIKDVKVKGPGLFELKVQGAAHLKTVYVRHAQHRTIAWTFDPAARCPQTGTFSIVDFYPDIRVAARSPIDRATVRTRISTALSEVLSTKGFQPVKQSDADILIRIVACVDQGIPIDDLQSSFGDRDIGEWKAALRTALQHDGVRNPTTLAQGTILMNLFDAASHTVLWRAAALGRFVVDVSERERDRRVRLAVSEMLDLFPPKAS